MDKTGRFLTCAVILMALTLLSPSGASHSEPLLASSAAAQPGGIPRIVNGVLTSDYPTGGALIALDAEADPFHILGCSGTLIGCETFLTAAHCVIDDPDPATVLVFLQHAGFFSVSSVEFHPDYNPNEDATGDVAVLKLATPVTGIAPSRINTTAPVGPGTSGTIVGFGITGGGFDDAGLKRVGDVVTGSCFDVSNDATSVCWSFESPLGPPGTDSNTCDGDSGGPLFVNTGSGDVVAGVTSFGDNFECFPEDLSVDASVFAHRAFIQAKGGADLANTTCGAIPQVGEPGASVYAATGEITNQDLEGRHTFEVPSDATLLRVALNAEEKADEPEFYLFIKAGSPPTTSDFDCASQRLGQWQFCEVVGPAAGTWHVLVSPFLTSEEPAQYQVTTTMFSSGGPLPTAAPTPVPTPGAQSKDQQKCLNALNKDGAKVASTQGKDNTACIKNATKGKESDAQGCLTADKKGKVAKAKSKTVADEAKNCAQTPTIGANSATTVNAVAVEQEIALVSDIFGDDVNAMISTDKAVGKCQSTVSKDYEKIATTGLKGFLKCKKNTLKAGASSAGALEDCVEAIPGDAKVAKAVAKLDADIGKKCVGVDTDAAIPGACAGSEDLATCVAERVMCRMCEMLNGMDNLSTDCDLVDDAEANGSCLL